MTFTRVGQSVVPLVALVALVHCSGGGSGTGGTIPSKPIVSGALVLKVPAAHGAADVRRAAFVSSGAASARVSVTGIATDVIANISTTAPNCTATTTGLTCTVAIAAPAGSDTFTVTLYAAANATGAVLGSGSATQTIGATANFSVTVPIVAVAASITVTQATPSPGASPATFVLGQSGTAQLQVNLNDASTAPTPVPIAGTYPIPITVTSSDSTGAAFTVSPTTLTASGQPLTVSYNGSQAVTFAVLTLSAGSGVTKQIAVCSVWCLSQNLPVSITFPQVTDATFGDGSPSPSTITWAVASPAGVVGTFTPSANVASSLGNSLTMSAASGSTLTPGQTTFGLTVTGQSGATATTPYPLVVTPPVDILVQGNDGCVGACVAPGGTVIIDWSNPFGAIAGVIWSGIIPGAWVTGTNPQFVPTTTTATTTTTVETIQTTAASALGGYLTSTTAIDNGTDLPVSPVTLYTLINLAANGPTQVTTPNGGMRTTRGVKTRSKVPR